jgi:hypothetical protein
MNLQWFKYLYNKTNHIHQFPKFTPAWNAVCFRQFLCPSSGVYSLYTQHWYMSYRFEDSISLHILLYHIAVFVLYSFSLVFLCFLCMFGNNEFYVHVIVHRKKFLYNKTNQMHQFPRFTPAWNSTCFGQFLCPSSGVYSLYTQHWYMSYRFEDSCLLL